MLPPALSKADLHLLHVFSTVVEARGFSAAQIVLNVSASTISRQVADLELRLGMHLCQRGRSGFLLTEQGELVYRAAQRLFAAVREFSDAMHGAQEDLRGPLSVATIDNWVFNDASPFALALRDLIEAAPALTLELFTLAPDDIELAVLDGRVSLGIGVFHRHRPGLVYERLGTETMGLYCAEGHPLFGLRDTADVTRQLASSRYARRAYLQETDIAPVSRGLQANAEAHQIEGIAQLILTGKYIGYLPQDFAGVWLREGRMWPVGGGAYDQPSEIKLVRKRGATPGQAAELMLRLVRRHASAPGAPEIGG